MPLNDRDYMRPSSSRRRNWRTGALGFFSINPLLLLISINLVIYLATIFNRTTLVANLGLAPFLFTERPWTLITNMFVHAEFWHFLGNMITLFFFGRVVEKIMGEWRFLVIYFAGGIGGNLLYLWLGESFSIAIGASGAVYALIGALVVLIPRLQVRLYFLIPMPLWVVVLVFSVGYSFFPGVAWQAHLGGLVVGLIAGFWFKRQMRYIAYR